MNVIVLAIVSNFLLSVILSHAAAHAGLVARG